MKPKTTSTSYRVTIEGQDFTVTFIERPDGLYSVIGGQEQLIEATTRTGAIKQHIKLGGRAISFGTRRTKEGVEVVLDGAVYAASVQDERALRYQGAVKAGAAKRGAVVKAPMPGLIVTVLVKAGDTVKRDQSLLSLNAMKLENDIRSPADGTVKEVLVKPEQAVEKGAKLIVLE